MFFAVLIIVRTKIVSKEGTPDTHATPKSLNQAFARKAPLCLWHTHPTVCLLLSQQLLSRPT